MAAIAARVYGPGISRTGQAITLAASAAGLEPSADIGVIRVPGWAALRWRRGGFNDTQLLIEWSTPQGDYTLSVEDPSAQRALLAHLPTGAREKQSGAQRSTRRVANWVIALVAVLPVLLIATFVTYSDHIVDWAVARIPVQTEISLGRQAFAQQRASLHLADDHPALPMIRELGARLTRGSEYPYEFHVALDPSVNAFAMPGGFVVFNTGLLAQADSAEEVAGVLAHEIQHVERRHGLRGLVHQAGWHVALSLLLGNTGGSLAAQWATQLGSLRFSRQQEWEADRLGVRRLITNQIDPHGMATFFRKLSRDGPGVPEFLSTHPSSDDRFEAIENSIPDGVKFPPLPYDYPRLKGS